MKLVKIFTMVAAVIACLAGGSLRADDTTTPPATPPTVVPAKPDFSKLPPEIKALIKDFEAARDSYQLKQAALLEHLKGATPAQREAIRAQLQANRQAFLDEVHSFRTEIKHELKGKHDPALDRWLENHVVTAKAHKGSSH